MWNARNMYLFHRINLKKIKINKNNTCIRIAYIGFSIVIIFNTI